VWPRPPFLQTVSEIELVFGIPPERPLPNIAPSWTVAPTDPLPVVRYDARVGERSLNGAWCRSGRRTPKSASRTVTPRPDRGHAGFPDAFQRRPCGEAVHDMTGRRTA